MPKTKKSISKALKPKKEKLTPQQRSDAAKARWTKRRANEAMEKIVVTINTMLEQDAAKDTPVPTPPPPEQPPVTPESITVDPVQTGSQEATPFPSILPDFSKISAAPQLTPVAPKKQKRIPVPKEFLTALKTADSLLAKAIEEFEDCQRRITYLSGSIPRLQRTVLALRNESNPDAPLPLPNAFNYNAPTTFQLPTHMLQPYVDPLAAIQAGVNMAALPVSGAQGGAIQLSPDVLGTLEGPEDDDDPDKYITGPLAGGGWK